MSASKVRRRSSKRRFSHEEIRMIRRQAVSMTYHQVAILHRCTSSQIGQIVGGESYNDVSDRPRRDDAETAPCVPI